MRFSRRKLRTAAAAGVILACTPTAPCACPPATTWFVVFGTIERATGTPAANATIGVNVFADGECSAEQAQFVAEALTANDAGRFRTTVRLTVGGGVRCVRLAAYAGQPGVTDSVVMPPVLVTFKSDRLDPDSLGVRFRLP